MRIESIFLIFIAIGLITLAGFDHYGLYIVIGIFWIISAFNNFLSLLALWSITIFMSGFALMRFAIIYTGSELANSDLGLLVLELLIALIGYWFIKKRRGYE